MPLAHALLIEFEQEMATTRKLLERVPEPNAEWKPHERSMSLGQLAAHIAALPRWGVRTLRETEYDARPVDREDPPAPPEWANRDDTLAVFDAAVGEARVALATTSDEEMMVVWTMKNAGRAVFEVPRPAAFRSLVLSHTIHHRGQLSVYLRLNGVPVPSIYGPSADEPM